MRIGLLGDMHGDLHFMQFAIDLFRTEGITTVLQLGDLGIWPGQEANAVWKRVNRLLVAADQTWYVTPGNHEDYDQINALPVQEDGWQHFRSNILLAPRGHRWVWDGISFVSLGGAPSVDRTWRTRARGPKLWWAEEEITEADAVKVIEGGHADVMVAHDAPLGIVQIKKHISDNPHGFEQVDLEYALRGRERMTEVFRAVRPEFFFHGHYHFKVSEFYQFNEESNDTCHVVGLAANPGGSGGQARFSMGEFDTDEYAAAVWDVLDAYNDWRSASYDDRMDWKKYEVSE